MAHTTRLRLQHTKLRLFMLLGSLLRAHSLGRLMLLSCSVFRKYSRAVAAMHVYHIGLRLIHAVEQRLHHFNPELPNPNPNASPNPNPDVNPYPKSQP